MDIRHESLRSGMESHIGVRYPPTSSVDLLPIEDERGKALLLIPLERRGADRT